MSKKITFIIYSLDCGGAERVISLLANYFSKNYYVEILVFLSVEPFYILKDNVTVKTIFYRKFNNSFLIKLNAVSRIFALFKIFSQRKNHVFISFTTTMNLISIISNLFLGNKLIISERADPKAHKISFIQSFLRLCLYHFSDHLVVQNKAQFSFFKNKFLSKKISIINNPLSKATDIKFDDDDVHIINVGRLVEQKNQFELIDIFYQSNLSCNLYIVGEGPLKDALQRYINDRGLEDRVFLLGLKSNIYKLLNPNWIFTSTSIFEGYPNALLEAMNASLACVHYNCPSGIEEIIDSGYNGFLINMNDLDSFSKKIIELVNNKKLRLTIGENAKRSVRHLYTENIAHQWVKLFSD